MQMNHRWILKARPEAGPLDESYFRYEEAQIPKIDEGEFLLSNNTISFDPSQRVWMVRDSYIPKIPLGDVVRALSVATVIESKNEDFPSGARVAGLFGWQEYAVSSSKSYFPGFIIPEGISDEAALSVFGMTGMTGYFGMKKIGQPRAGETVVVSGASGATGSIAAQVAKNLGARVIGIAGGKAKCAWLAEIAKLDAVIDYKTSNIDEELKKLAPSGVDVFFDNVGGAMLDAVLAHLAMHARVVICGAISTYEGTSSGAISNYLQLIMKRARMEGFLVSDFAAEFPEGIAALASMLSQGKLHYEVDIQYGLENAPKTLQRLFDGQNMGKQLLRI